MVGLDDVCEWSLSVCDTKQAEYQSYLYELLIIGIVTVVVNCESCG